MANNKLTPTEVLELHELLNENILSIKKIKSNISMVQDENLKNIMQNTLNNKKTKIQEFQNFINNQLNAQNNQNNN
ncbi:similar to spore coat protein [Clostridium sp. USBA 49]|jgi:similar to spore coat protein|uniref:hypothetical protein n=1 Tax=Clostridium TaxID=1485 RepID=UPI00099A03D1|nr:MULTISPECIES: hypothetical protein [Clostridium]SKA73244.1 similar to spore coat protein [Clostridium sp. USBA 49]